MNHSNYTARLKDKIIEKGIFLEEKYLDDLSELISQEAFLYRSQYQQTDSIELQKEIELLQYELKGYRERLNAHNFLDSKKTIAHLVGRLVIDFFKNPIKNFITPKKMLSIYIQFLDRKRKKILLSKIENKIFRYFSKGIDISSKSNLDELDFNESFQEENLYERLSLSKKMNKSISDYITQLKKSDRLIILYTTAPYIGHPTLELRPNRLAKEYLALGYKVIFFSFSRVPAELVTPGEYPHLLQCFKDDLFSVLTQLSEWEGKERIFICSSFPDIFAMTAIEKLKMEQHWRTIYEIRDDMEEFNRVGYSKWYSSQLEINVAQLVDKVVTVSPRLAQKIKVMASLKDSNKVKVIQNAAPNQLIKKSEHLRTPLFFDIKNQSKKIGYIGHLTPSWFDWTLLINTAKKYSDWQFEIIGHGMPKNLVLPKNICFLGSKTHDEFLEISKYWKVGLIPFIKSPLTSGVDPNKIYEYLSANLLVVTANMGSVKECPATFVYDENEQFENMLKQAMSTEFNQLLLNEINEYVEKSRWSDRAKSMIKFISV